MDAQAILTVSAAVVALTQLAKWGFVPDKWGPVSVVLLSILGVAFWGWSTGDFNRASSFGYFAGAIAVMTSAAGVFGFTRAGSEAITKTSGQPPGAGGGKTNGFTSQDLKGIGIVVLAGSIAVSQLACGNNGVLRGFRAALEASPALVSSLVSAHVITQVQADAVIADFKDGTDVALALESDFKTISSSDPDARAKKLAASLKAMRAWRLIINRRNFQVNERITQAADIADGILSSLVVFYSDDTGSGIRRSAASKASVQGVGDEKDLERRLRVEVERLKQALKP